MSRDNVIRLFDDYCERYQAQERPDVRRYLALAGKNADQLGELVDQYLQLAPIPPPHPEDIEWLREILRQAGF